MVVFRVSPMRWCNIDHFKWFQFNSPRSLLATGADFGGEDIWIEDIDNLVTGDRRRHMSRGLSWCHVTFVTWCHDTDVSTDIVIMTPDQPASVIISMLIDMTPNYGDHYWSSHCPRIHHSRWSLQTLVTSLCWCHRLEWSKIIKMSMPWIYWSPPAYSL